MPNSLALQEARCDVAAQHPRETADLESREVGCSAAGDRLGEQLGDEVGGSGAGDLEPVAEVGEAVGVRDALGEEGLVSGVVGPQGERHVSGRTGGGAPGATGGECGARPQSQGAAEHGSA
ncbi:hypothetical protein ACWD1Y_44370 [Streptomyces sp. NPDC002814]